MEFAVPTSPFRMESQNVDPEAQFHLFQSAVIHFDFAILREWNGC